MRENTTSGSAVKSPASPRTRKSLLVRLKDWHDQDSWAEFSSIYTRLIYQTALKSGLLEVEAQEVLQETLLSVAKKIASFDYNPDIGSFKSWLLQITRRRVVDQFRKRHPGTAEASVGHSYVPIDQIAGALDCRFDAIWDQEWRDAVLELARAMVKRRVGDRQYRMFEMYVLRELPMAQVTSQLGVNRAQVYMAKYRIRQLLKKEMVNLQKAI